MPDKPSPEWKRLGVLQLSRLCGDDIIRHEGRFYRVYELERGNRWTGIIVYPVEKSPAFGNREIISKRNHVRITVWTD